MSFRTQRRSVDRVGGGCPERRLDGICVFACAPHPMLAAGGEGSHVSGCRIFTVCSVWLVPTSGLRTA